jgi:hypothetical protein
MHELQQFGHNVARAFDRRIADADQEHQPIILATFLVTFVIVRLLFTGFVGITRQDGELRKTIAVGVGLGVLGGSFWLDLGRASERLVS